MCIRDRLPTGPAMRKAAQPAPARQPAVRHARSGVDPFPECCLLYTSDAADERSSVDLGGRRIIKKKTNNDTRGLH